MSKKANKLYGEPVKLKGKTLYFTSWKYVRQGSFKWQIDNGEGIDYARQLEGFLLDDGNKPAYYEGYDLPKGIQLVAQKAEKKVMLDFSPGCQIHDNGVYKAWYTIVPDAEKTLNAGKNKTVPARRNGYLCYAESKDGMHWNTPELGIHQYNGNRKNNIVFHNDIPGSVRGFHGGTVFVDPSSKSERYKMVYNASISDDEWEQFEQKYPGEIDTMAKCQDLLGCRSVFAVFGAVSPDGIHWSNLSEPLMVQHSDTVNICYYDVDMGKYVFYGRGRQVDEKAPEMRDAFNDSWIGVGRRSISRSVTDDFRHFPRPELVISPGADMDPSHVWYNSSKTTLPGCPDMHVMLPWRYELIPDSGDIYLFSSADGWIWSQVPGGPVIERGRLGDCDGGYIIAGINMLEYADNKWGIPFAGYPIPHKYPGRNMSKRKGLFPGVSDCMGIAMWPKGRLVALDCPREGQFATVGLVPPANRIKLNATIYPTGYIKVGVRSLYKGQISNRSLSECDRIIGDHLSVTVSWNGESNINHNDDPIVLEFEMRSAKLFGVEFY